MYYLRNRGSNSRSSGGAGETDHPRRRRAVASPPAENGAHHPPPGSRDHAPLALPHPPAPRSAHSPRSVVPAPARAAPPALDTVELVVPVELDPADGGHPCAVRITSADGSFTRTLDLRSAGVDRHPKHPVATYHFHLVPLGTYEVAFEARGRWHVVVGGLEVGPEGPVHGERPFAGEARGESMGTPRHVEVEAPPTAESPRRYAELDPMMWGAPADDAEDA